MYKTKIPKILFIALDIAKFYRRDFYNTNDLAQLANKYKEKLVRLRVDKTDYRYFEDTKFGGLRGNFSTLVTWKGFIKRGSSIVNKCSIGRDNRIINAVCNGEIILDRKKLTANTNNIRLKELLELESWLFNIRENQAHIKVMLERNKNIPLVRDKDNFPKVSVVKTLKGQYFLRAIVNNFVDTRNMILEYSLLNLWEGKKLKKKNLHPLFAIPSKSNAWSKICAIRNEDLFNGMPMLIDINLKNNSCSDKQGKKYKLYTLGEAIEAFSSGDKNIKKRLDYNWTDLKNNLCKEEVARKKIKQDEFSAFLDKFLLWKKEFYIGAKKVVKVKVSSSGGPDVILTYSGGTTQMLELEHNWKSYFDHKHHKSNAWANTWLFAEEEWDRSKILKLFKRQKVKHGNRIPDVFFCIEKGERRIYKANWEINSFTEISLRF